MAYREDLSVELSEHQPQSLEAEQSVLGAVLLEPSCLVTVLEYLNADCFYTKQHRQIFSAILMMFSSGQQIDFITVDVYKRQQYS